MEVWHVVKDNPLSQNKPLFFLKKDCPAQPGSCVLCDDAARHSQNSHPIGSQFFLSSLKPLCPVDLPTKMHDIMTSCVRLGI